MKNLINHITYALSIFLAAATKVSMILLSIKLIISLLNGSAFADGKLNMSAIYYGAGILACTILERILLKIRVDAREKKDFDEDENRKRLSYKYLSATEKKTLDLQKLQEQELLISTSELKRLIHIGSKTPEYELNKLIGLDSIKNEILNMKAKMEYDKKYKKQKSDSIASMHMCFLGNPGTGKTTVARIMTGILYQYGYIKINKCIEVDAAELKGTTPENTLKRTKMILNRAKNGVLFIDEAYSLLSGINGPELIAELVKYMEDNKNSFVLILAGYPDNMKRLIESNPGLYSRFNKYLWFKDYDMNELKDIFTMIANDAGYCIDDVAYEKFEIRIAKEKRCKNFGNARSVKNLVQKALEKHAYNVINGIIGKEQAYIITGADIDTDVQNQFNF